MIHQWATVLETITASPPKMLVDKVYIDIKSIRSKNLLAQFLHMFHRRSQQLLQSPQHLQGSCLSADHMPA